MVDRLYCEVNAETRKMIWLKEFFGVLGDENNCYGSWKYEGEK